MRDGGSLTYRPEIDGLRAVAVVAVIAYHAAPGLVPGGFVGVDVFFVVSGYLISTIILKAKDERRFFLLNFYARRIKRLFPALIAMLTATLLIGWFVLLPHEFRHLGRHIVAGAAYFLNFTLKQEAGYFDASAEEKPLLHLWSLAVEEQFYIVWPLLLIAASRRHLRTVLIAVTLASFASSLVAVATSPKSAFFLPHNRFWELSAGGLLAFAQLHAPDRMTTWTQRLARRGGIAGATVIDLLSWLGLALIAVAALRFDPRLAFPGAWALVPCSGALCLLAAGPQASANRMLLSRQAMVWCGLISYPLYLWHWPLLSFSSILGHDHDVGVRMAAVGLAFVLAWLTYRFIERPARSARRSPVPALLTVSLGFCLAGFLVQSGLIEPRLNEARHHDVGDAIADWAFPTPTLTRERRGGGIRVDSAGTHAPRVMYLGDSNMQQYWPRIERLLADGRTTKSVLFVTTGGCPPIPGLHERTRRNCTGFAESALDRARDPQITSVVIAAQWYGYFTNPDYYLAGSGPLVPGSQSWDLAFAALAELIRELRSGGKSVWLVLNIPVGAPLAPARSVSRPLTGNDELRMPALDRLEFEKTWEPIRRRLVAIAAETGSGVIDPMATLCGPVVCPGVSPQGRLIYKDQAHLRASYVRDSADFMDRTLLDPP